MRERTTKRQAANESPPVTLPGRFYRKRARWWWKVQLPGEKSPRDRALKPEGSARATTDPQIAGRIALTLWENAVRTETRATVLAEQAAQMQQLKQDFREKTRALNDVIARAEARAEAETARRAGMQVELNGLRNQLTQMVTCDGCGRSVPESKSQEIDSGQRLCLDCMAALYGATKPPQRAGHGEAGPQTAGQDPSRSLPPVPCAASSANGEDVFTRREIHEFDVLYAQAGRR